ncbi:DUF6236 family protein [Streptomyces sp. NPDC051976]|uniref:DUF6236 family protein n=1 Tax=Streptomyces sp. NPDC051976 TaxID=3154947 RepID=UPI0034142EEA
MPSIALYYPWRHFQEESSVKLALLTWDKLVRVRPPELTELWDDDTDLVRQLRSETDFLIETVPSKADLAAVTDAFRALLTTHGQEITGRFGLQTPIVYSHEDRQYRMAVSNNPFPGNYEFSLYSDPANPLIGRELSDLLISSDLARRVTGTGYREWISVRSPMGSAYMAALSDAIARHNMTSLVTDDPRMHRAVGALDRLPEMLLRDEPQPPGFEDADSAYLQVAIQAVLEPLNLLDLPLSKLIRFRDRYRAELAAFRIHLEEVSTELQAIAAVENLAVAHAHLESLYVRHTKPKLDDLRRALRALGVESTSGAMVLKIDANAAAGTILGAVAAAGGQLAVAGVATAIAVFPYVASRLMSRRQTIVGSPVAYLLAAERELGSTSLIRWRRH